MAEPLPTSLLLPAPAKLNLFLHITGRRADGYHELQTLFQLLDCGDWLELTALAPGAGIRFDSNFPEVAPADNLVVRAARALQAATGTERGAAIRLDKRLPAGGGLGGGSSDAATTLLGLNRLWQTGLSLDQLATIGLQLGADVPVFVHGHTAWAEGVGERLQAVDLPARVYLILHPGVSVSTARVFGDKYLTRNSPPITIAAFLSRGGRNDCEAVVRKAWPEVDKAFDWLARFATPRLTGTGACLFAAFPTEAEAQAILAQLPAPWSGFVARGVNRSPLHRQLGF